MDLVVVSENHKFFLCLLFILNPGMWNLTPSIWAENSSLHETCTLKNHRQV